MSDDTIDMNLDTLENEKAPKKPYAFSMTDPATNEPRRIVLANPHDIDWKTLLEMEKPLELLKECLTAGDREFLRDNPIPNWKFTKLMEAFFKHYGFDLAKGKEDASSIL